MSAERNMIMEQGFMIAKLVGLLLLTHMLIIVEGGVHIRMRIITLLSL